jgi:CO/xanthine dehydrogenase Mo-binding subunit
MTITRRSFLRVTATLGGGMLVCFRLPACAPRGRSVESAGARLDTEAGGDGGTLTAYFRIESDGGVTVMAHKVEMGQGTWTSLPMILADELDADWSRVTVTPAPYDEQRYGWQGVGGSTSLWEGWVPLRQAGAAAREMLRAAAAQRFGVPASELRTEAGRVLHDASGRSAHYGELAADAAALPIPEDPPLKDPSTFRIIGAHASGRTGPDRDRAYALRVRHAHAGHAARNGGASAVARRAAGARR